MGGKGRQKIGQDNVGKNGDDVEHRDIKMTLHRARETIDSKYTLTVIQLKLKE